jgi:uncharacterized protein (DUF2147 family)
VSTGHSRRNVLAMLAAGVALLSTGARGDTASDPRILGMWLTQAKDGVIEFYLSASGMLQGRIVARSSAIARLDENNPVAALRTRSIDGAVILQGFRYAGDGKWMDGSVYDPLSGRTYRCNMELKNADTLSVHGYVGLPVFGRSELWTRKK